MRKNQSGQVVGAQLVNASDGTAFTGSVTCYVTGDGGTQAAGSVGSGAATHEGNGFHTYAPAQAETNYDHVAFTFTGTGAVPVTVQVYPVSQAFPSNFASLAINGSGHVVLQDSSLVTAKLGTFELAKTTNITGFNDIAATAIVSGGAITTNSGAVSNVTTTATATNLTNLPSIPNNWITTAGINDGAFTAAKFASGAFDAVWSVTTRTLSSFGTLVSDVWSHATRILTAGTNIALAKGTGVTGFNDLDAAGVRTAVGLGAADLDTQLSTIDTVVDGIAVQTTRVDGLIEDSTGDRFTAKALEEAPSGGGDDAATVYSYFTAESREEAFQADISSLPSAGDIADAVWDEAIAGHLTSGSTGAALNAAGSSGDPWETSLPGSYAAGTAGYIIGTNIDAAISSRSTYAGADTSGTTTLLSRLSADRAGYIDKLNVSGVIAHSDAAATYRADVSGLLTSSAFDTRISATRAGYIDKLNVSGTLAHTDNASTFRADVSGLSTSAEIAALETHGDSNWTTADVSGLAEKTDLPDNFATLGISASGHLSRVTLVDTTTANTDMRGTDNALLAANYAAPPSVSDIVTTQLTEAYRATGAAPTLAQFVFEVVAHLGNAGIAGTTKTLTRLDKTTTAKTFTLDDADAPTSIEEAT
jgi:hypothetical protein